jgi:hypothetical protein
MADYGGAYNDPTLGYYGGGQSYLSTDIGLSPLGPTGSAPAPAATQNAATTPQTSSTQTGLSPTTFGPTIAGAFKPPNGVPDPQNPGYDTAGYFLGSTYDSATGTLTIKRPDGSTAVTELDPATHQPRKRGGVGQPPFGTVFTDAPKPPQTNPGTNIYDPSLYTPYTRPAPVYTPPPAFKAPTLDEAANQPGYQFGLQQGEQALQQSAAARGVLRTGGTLKGILDYGRNAATQNYANVLGQNLGVYNTNLATQYQQPFENAFATFIAEQNRFRQNQQDPFSKYLQLIQTSNPNA